MHPGGTIVFLGYELTKLEKKTGSPEKPLSALGQMTYKSYWHSTVLTKLEEYRRGQIHVTLTQLRLVDLSIDSAKIVPLPSSTDTGICMEDILQTLIDLRLAYTGTPNTEAAAKPNDNRNRRRAKVAREGNPCDSNNNHLDSAALVTIDEDALRVALHRLSTGNLASKHNQNAFDATYLRVINRR